ncbi:siderophore-interacting protein [Streptomyces sp. SDT5-1]|uniref:siderophore-interacting protein n=1 Tax=Streptomyces sp. SDT5-1 TaxID=3406418 RepID=UPI003FD0478F
MAWNRFAGTFLNRVDLTKSVFRVEFEITGDRPGYGYVPVMPGDESVGLYFAEGGHLLDTRSSTAEFAHGGWEAIDDGRSLGRRNFTVRSFASDANVMAIDVARHGSGPAIEWFDNARPGWRLLMAGARSWHSPPEERVEDHYLVADLAGLPALARIVEATDPHVRVTALVEVLDPSDLEYVPPHPNLELISLVGSGNGVTESRLADSFAELTDLDAASYQWIAAESAQVRLVKKYLRGRGFDKSRCVALGYWNDARH